MIGISNLPGTQIFLLCLILVGVITVKIRIVDEHTRFSVSDLILNVFLPCNILSSFLGANRSQLPSLGIILLVSLGIIVFSFLFSLVIYRKTGPEQRKVLLYATIISNASFVGNPVVESIFGLEGLTYASAYLIPLRMSLWTVGLAVFTGGRGNLKKVLFHPCLLATYAGLIIMISGFTPPSLVSRLTFSLGNCTTPLSMIVVGNILAMVDPKKLINTMTIWFAFIRLLLIPLFVMGILLIFRPDPMISGIAVILSGMPAPVTTTILADKYGADRELACKIVFVSTILSIVTIPVLALLLTKL